MEEQGLRYRGRSLYDDLPVFNRNQRESPYYQENREEFDLLTKNYSTLIRNERMAPVSIRKISEDVGWGLFCEKDMKPGDFLGEYAGLVRPGVDLIVDPGDPHPPEGYDTDYTWDYPDAWYEDELYEVNAGTLGNELRYINHSFEPNLAVEHTLVDNRWVIFFVASRLIHAGNQFFVDYGEEYWSGGFRELVLF